MILRVESNKGKSRWVPFDETLAKELSDYLRERRLINPASEDRPFLVQPNGSPCGLPIVPQRITVLLRQTGMKPRTGRVGPRYASQLCSQSAHRMVPRGHRRAGASRVAVGIPWTR